MNDPLYGGSGRYAVLTVDDIRESVKRLMEQQSPMDAKLVWFGANRAETVTNQEWNERMRALMQ